LLQCERAGFFRRRVPGICRSVGGARTVAAQGRKSPRPSKGPAQFPGRAQCVSFNFLNRLICPAVSSAFVARMERSEMRERPSRIAALRASIQATICDRSLLKVMMPVGAVMAAGVEAARLEISVRSRRGTGRCDRASRPARHRRGRSAGRASPGFPTGTTSAAYGWPRKQRRSSKSRCLRMAHLHQKKRPGAARGFYHWESGCTNSARRTGLGPGHGPSRPARRGSLRGGSVAGNHVARIDLISNFRKTDSTDCCWGLQMRSFDARQRQRKDIL
jgi:hypothetical protein